MVKSTVRWLAALMLGAGFAAPAAAQTRILGSDSAACVRGGGPGILVTVVGLKDRIGRLKLELYPATEQDFLRDDRDLIRDGRFFRRVWSPTPAAGEVQMCIRAPRPGRYALLFTHDRDGRNKFDFWKDGAGFPSNTRLGRRRPTLDQAVISVGADVTTVTIRAQYLRGLGGFAPLGN